MAIPGDMVEFLRQKYAIMQQQADATTQNAATAALTGGAQARLLGTQTRLMPAESAANVAKTTAETGLIDQQTKFFGPEAMARIANMGAQSDLTRAQTVGERQMNQQFTTPMEGAGWASDPTKLPSSLRNVLGMRGYQGYRLGGL